MASKSTPRLQAFKADGSIAAGLAVKMGTDKNHVAVCTATTDRAIGIVQDGSTAAGDMVVVQLPGGGGSAKLGGTVVAGANLVPTTDGSLIKASASADACIARALDGGSSGDVIAVEVQIFMAVAADT